MVALRPNLWHLSALVGASALALGLLRSAGPKALTALGLTLGCSILIHAILAANRRAGRAATRWIRRGLSRGGTAGLALTTAALAFKGAALAASVLATVGLIGSAMILFRLCCVDRYFP